MKMKNILQLGVGFILREIISLLAESGDLLSVGLGTCLRGALLAFLGGGLLLDSFSRLGRSFLSFSSSFGLLRHSQINLN